MSAPTTSVASRKRPSAEYELTYWRIGVFVTSMPASSAVARLLALSQPTIKPTEPESRSTCTITRGTSSRGNKPSMNNSMLSATGSHRAVTNTNLSAKYPPMSAMSPKTTVMTELYQLLNRFVFNHCAAVLSLWRGLSASASACMIGPPASDGGTVYPQSSLMAISPPVGSVD